MNPVLLGLISLYKGFRKLWLKVNRKTEEDVVNREFVEVEVWESFCDNLKVAGTALYTKEFLVIHFNRRKAFVIFQD